MQLGLNADGTILAVDNYQPYLDELNRRAEIMGVSEKIQTCLGDMHNLKLDAGAFDLIWSEGALYIMGFRNGLESCFRLLAPGGSVAVTELCCLRHDTPDECRRFFESEYPGMVDVDTNLATIKACGYDLLGHFTLPESSWWEPYYEPLEVRLSNFRRQCAADPEKLKIIEWVQSEIDLYREYSSYYGYVFYMMQR
jgi:SAM-dependent methyltransferase